MGVGGLVARGNDSSVPASSPRRVCYVTALGSSLLRGALVPRLRRSSPAGELEGLVCQPHTPKRAPCPLCGFCLEDVSFLPAWTQECAVFTHKYDSGTPPAPCSAPRPSQVQVDKSDPITLCFLPSPPCLVLRGKVLLWEDL